LASFFSTCAWPFIQLGRFLAGQLARRDALIDPLLLVGLALVDAGSGRRILRRCGRGLRQNGQGKSGKDSDQQTGCAFHLLLLVFAMGQPHAPNNAGGHPALTIEM
jgi:hypothetical protein